MFRARVDRIRKKLLVEKLDGVFISSVSNIEYLTGYSNFSRDEREAYILIGNNFEYIVTDGRYSEAVIKNVPHLTLFERGHKKTVEHLFKKHKKEIKKLGIEEDHLTVAEFKIVKKHFKNIKHFNVAHLRSIKNNDEIEKIKKACNLGDKAFKYILRKIKVGVTEKQVAQELGSYIKGQGAEFSFPAIVAFGKNSSVPHHQTGDTILGPSTRSARSGREGQFILLDFGVKVDGYCSDMTRTVFFGKPSKKQVDIYKTVFEAQQKAVDFISNSIKSGKKVKASGVDKVGREYIKSKGYPDIPHSLGHGIGLEVHEHPSLSPKSKEELKIGMVFSIEPGIYIPDFGSPRSTPASPSLDGRVEAGGVRIEDLYVLEKDGLRQITSAPKNLITI